MCVCFFFSIQEGFVLFQESLPEKFEIFFSPCLRRIETNGRFITSHTNSA